jgi:NAD(P)-dependent dehydrogenase (short-subunit alcohol dehydrogenase family)
MVRWSWYRRLQRDRPGDRACVRRAGGAGGGGRAPGDALEELAWQCQAAGGQALAVPTDMTDEAAVAELVRRAVERFGRIDIWVNNAGVYLLGLLEATPPEAFRRVLETNQAAMLDLPTGLERITCPVLLLQGTADPLVSMQSPRFLAFIRHAAIPSRLADHDAGPRQSRHTTVTSSARSPATERWRAAGHLVPDPPRR